MKIALVHELLTMRGGAERVLKILADMYPDAPIYTLLYNKKKLGDWFPKHRVHTPSIPTPYSLLPTPYKYNHHLYLRKFPPMVESWDFSDYDVVLSTSSAFVHNIITNGKPKHLSYINAPARYLWDRTFDVQERAGKGLLGPLKKEYLQRRFHKLREWDSENAGRADKLLAASKDVERRIELYWRRDSDVVYPPIDDFWLDSNIRVSEYPNTGGYFLIVSTLVPYKQIDIAIKACQMIGAPLKIVGEGPDRKRLESISDNRSLITFLGYQDSNSLKEFYANAKALLFPGIEDFGLAPLEAMACGTPVISYRAGGPLETIVEGKTGVFFDEQTPECLADTLQSFDKNTFDPQVCKDRAAEFSRERFEDQIRKHVMNANATF